jgi:hypothetical protein
LLIIGLFVTVLASRDRQITTQYAQTAVPTSTPGSATITPTFGCLGTSCVGTPSAVTTTPRAASPSAGVTILVPVNPNGKTPPGLINSFSKRLRNWIRKYIHFGGNPPGNPNIPGTNINPLASPSGNVIIIGPGKGNNPNKQLVPVKLATPSGMTVPTNPRNIFQPVQDFLRRLFGR